MRRPYGYGSYRGRSRGRTALKVLIGVLAAVLILVVVGAFLLEPYLVYTSDGVRVDLPFGQDGENTPGQPQPSEDLSVVVVTPTLTPAPQTFRAVTLPLSALTDGTAAAQAEAAGADAVVFDMKADDGTLAYVSNLEEAMDAGASASDPGLNDAIRTLTAGDLHVVARVSCFRDNTVPYYNNRTALRTAIGNWRDAGNYRWLSPGRAAARSYVAGVCRELASLGFDELLLDHPAFPTQADGTLTNLTVGEAYPTDDLAGQVELFYSEVRSALADYPATMLSIVSTPEVLAGTDNQSGQTAAQLAEYADRIWVQADEAQAASGAAALTAAGMEDAGDRMVRITDALPAGGTGCWAVLDMER